MVMLFVILLNIISMMFYSDLKSSRIFHNSSEELETMKAELNFTGGNMLFLVMNSTPHPINMVLELSTTVVLFYELLIKSVMCRERQKHLFNIYTFIDVICILPQAALIIYGNYIKAAYGDDPQAYMRAQRFNLILYGVSMLRIFRMFRPLKQIRVLKVLVLALRQSHKELLLLFGMVGTLAMIWGSLVFFAEIQHDTFENIPEGMWWALVTMTTVGYGDFYPQGSFGYVVGSLAALSGILVLALPIPIVANNFDFQYKVCKIMDKIKQRNDSVAKAKLKHRDITVQDIL